MRIVLKLELDLPPPLKDRGRGPLQGKETLWRIRGAFVIRLERAVKARNVGGCAMFPATSDGFW